MSKKPNRRSRREAERARAATATATGGPEAAPQGHGRQQRQHRRRRAGALAALLAGVVAVGASAYVMLRPATDGADASAAESPAARAATAIPPPPPLPQPDLSHFDPPVQEKVELMLDAVRQRPRSAEAWSRLAMTFQAHNMTAEAIPAYEYAATLDPKNFRWPYLLGTLVLLESHDEAIPWLKRASDLEPMYVPVHTHLAQALMEVGRLEEAAAAAERALAAQPNYAYSNFVRAKVALAASDPQTALQYLNVALTSDPEFRDAHGLAAEAYRRLNQPDAARRHAEAFDRLPLKAQLSDPVFAEMRREGVGPYWDVTRGQAALVENRPADALAAFDAALRYRETSEALQGRGEALMALGDLDRALDAFTRALELDPQFPDAYLRIALVHAKSGRWPEALAVARSGHAAVPGDFNLARLLATFLAAAPEPSVRDGAEAVRIMEGLIERHRTDGAPLATRADSLDRLAVSYASVGRFDEAIETAQRAQAQARAAGETGLAMGIEQRLNFFRRGEPYVQASW